MRDRFLRRNVLTADLVTGEVKRPAGLAIPVPAPRNSRVLVRLHGHPLGTVDLDDVEPTPCNVRKAALKHLGRAVATHLDADGLEMVSDHNHFGDLPDARACSANLAHIPEPAPLVTVAIATMNNADSCVQTALSVLASEYTNFELLVVDNDPSKETEDAVGSIHDERIRYVAEPRRGLSCVRNRSLAEARGDYIAFSDDDVNVDKYWMSAIVRTFARDTTIACVTGSILAAELETPAQAMLEQFGGFNKGSQRQIFDMGEHRRDSPLYPYAAGRFGSGANMAFRVEALRRIGSFAEDLGAGTLAHGGEDIDILRRVVSGGDVLVYEPAALIWHSHRRSYRALERQMFRYGVGLSATITKWMLEGRGTAFDIARRVPAGMHYALSPHSEKNENKATSYPKLLTRLELAGFLYGPIAYLRSRSTLKRNSS